MCDDLTDEAADRALAACGMSRREFAALGASAALAGCAGTGGSAGDPLVETTVRIATPDGFADGFFVHPAKGAHPGVIIWPDIAGLREAKKIMARRLAGSGYAVVVVNPYYRSAPAPVMASFAEFMQPAMRERAMKYRELLTPEAVTRDALAWVAFLDSQAPVDKRRRIGTQGYCMGGPFAMRTAIASPGRVGAAASFHGGGLVTDQPDSPHLLLGQSKASFLIATARNDDARAPEEKDTLRKAAAAAGRPAEVVVYPADHGWCVPDSPVYDPVQADLAWEQLLGLYLGAL